MAIGVIYNTLVDVRAVGAEVVRSDFFTIPGVAGPGTVLYYMVEVPLDVVTAPSVTDPIYIRTVDPITHLPLGPVFSLVTYPTSPIATQFQVNPATTFTFGTILLSQGDAGSTLEIIYTGRGSLVHAADVNDPRDELTDGRDTEFSIGDRMSFIEDGTRIENEAIVPRHISTTPTDDFTFPGDLIVNGDLDVKGTVTYIESTTVNIKDNFINLNTGETGAPTLDAGITVKRGTSSDVLMQWKESSTQWEFTGAGLHLPDGNLNLESHQLKKASFELVASQIAENALTPFQGHVIYRTDLDAPRVYSSSDAAYLTMGVRIKRVDYIVGTPSGTYTGSTTQFDLPWMYLLGTSQLFVYWNGQLQTITADYNENTTTRFTFVGALTAGDKVAVVNLAQPV